MLNSSIGDRAPISRGFKKCYVIEYYILENGWITPSDGYKYKRTANLRSWSESRRVCESWEGDLIQLADIAATVRK